MKQSDTHYILSDGQINIWIEQEAIHIKAATPHNDPVELRKEEAAELAEILKGLVEKLID